MGQATWGPCVTTVSRRFFGRYSCHKYSCLFFCIWSRRQIVNNHPHLWLCADQFMIKARGAGFGAAWFTTDTHRHEHAKDAGNQLTVYITLQEGEWTSRRSRHVAPIHPPGRDG